MKKKILLGIDFIGSNFPGAIYTIQQWWKYVTSDNKYDCILGVSNFCNRNSPLPGAWDLSPTKVKEVLRCFIPKKKLVQWTSDIDAILLQTLQKEKRFKSKPFFSEFNYGSVVNRLLLLAYSHDCDYLVRIDPGTIPPKGKPFVDLMAEHESIIDGQINTVVSRRYADRLALRNIFVKEGKENFHAELVKKYTGIDVYAQITGGAMLTLKSPGTPAICFPPGDGLTLVWASDDGIYQVLPETKTKSRMLPDYPVQRFDAVGKPKKSIEYYRGIIGAVCLNTLRNGKTLKIAKQNAEQFLQKLKADILDVEKCSLMDADPNWNTTFCLKNIAPQPFIKAIADGYKNYIQLLDEWKEICNILKSLIVQKT